MRFCVTTFNVALDNSSQKYTKYCSVVGKSESLFSSSLKCDVACGVTVIPAVGLMTTVPPPALVLHCTGGDGDGLGNIPPSE